MDRTHFADEVTLKHIEASLRHIATLENRVQILAKALREARDDMQDWQAYASDYFLAKNKAPAGIKTVVAAVAAKDLDKIDAALREAGLGE